MTTKTEDSTKYVEELKEWINRQPHLPKNLGNNLLLRFAHSCYYDLEKTKKTVDMFFTVRGACSDLVTNRDPQSAHMQKVIKIINLSQYGISGNRWLWIWQLNDPGLENYDYISDVKFFFLSTDSNFLVSDNLPEEDIVMMDVKDITLRFLTKINLSVARRLAKYQEEAMPIRLKQIHVVNAPPFIDKIYGALKPFMKKEITEMIHFHPPKSDTLYKYLSKDDLPSNYGGTRPSMAELKEEVMDNIARNRDALLDETLWRVVDKKKAESSIDSGSFRTLAID
ncbi:alpha-tocopherol transfer protein-like [Vanessa atalanta]|uniref:alpha-tocopherol transfer protein-like n=1 Tax=Vanessa atalanta TaxID=42275 RepID=UPI001FCD653D|nr:alpha-tocopherol transfer protein-like [Vanessa atalanta]XP_047532289.1 alpha-tocopherol transfer protein-like [Vanessa atalanta]